MVWWCGLGGGSGDEHPVPRRPGRLHPLHRARLHWQQETRWAGGRAAEMVDGEGGALKLMGAACLPAVLWVQGMGRCTAGGGGRA